MTQQAPFQYGVITDEIDMDLEAALKLAKSLGMTHVELNNVWDKPVADLNAEEIERAKVLLDTYGLRVHVICSMLFRPFELDDIELATMEDHPRFQDHMAQLDRSIVIAKALGAPYIRTFAFSRHAGFGNPSPRFPDGGGIPADVLAKIAKGLRIACERAAAAGITLALENARAFYANTGGNQRKILDAVDHPNLKIIWDPANAFVAGETPFPDGYNAVKGHIVDVHCKDARVADASTGLTEWMPIGSGGTDWKPQIAALIGTGVTTLTIETHWHPAGSTKGADTRHVLEQLQGIVAEVSA
jgi:sugar phosphate isomerase/epimerase